MDYTNVWVAQLSWSNQTIYHLLRDINFSHYPDPGGGETFSQKWKNKEEFIVKKRGNGNRREKRGGKTEVKRGIGVKRGTILI